MSRYQEIAASIERLIQEGEFPPGSALPPERELARRFKVGYGTVRLANQLLIQRGIVDRQQGRGSFVVGVSSERSDRVRGRHGRVGLLFVDQVALTAGFTQELTLELQRVAAARGYDLAIEPMHTEDLILGRLPRMLTDSMVDGLLLSGYVRDHHVKLIEERQLPFVVIGNTPLPMSVPQIRLDAEGLAFGITRELSRIGRHPIWFDANPANTRYQTGQELFRGYAEAMRQFGDGSIYLCELKAERIIEVAQTLCRGDLEKAAYVVSDWSYPLLPMALRMKTPEATRLLIVPLVRQLYGQALAGPNIMQWSARNDVSDFAEPAVNGLVDVIEGAGPFQSVVVEVHCRTIELSPVPRIQARVVRRRVAATAPLAATWP